MRCPDPRDLARPYEERGGWPTERDAEHPLFKVGHRFGLWDGVFRVLAIEIVLAAVLLAGWGIERMARAETLRPVDLALVLAVDVSGSITDASWRLQRDGIADALASDGFAHSIAAGQIGRVAVAVLQWGTMARIALAWRIVETPAEARALAEAIRRLEREESGGTCMGAAVRAAHQALAAWAEHASRRVIDVSGDGASNCGIEVAPPRAAALADGITLNGLPIVTAAEPLVDRWYEDNVIGGPGAFLVVAEGYASFAEAFRKKLTIETAGLPGGEDR